MISAIILGAGESSRFGELKQLYQIEGTSFLNLIISNLEKINEIKEIILVLGYKSEYIKDTIISEEANLKIVVNKEYERGQLSSFQTGIKESNDTTSGYLMVLCDHPFVLRQTYSLLIDEFKNIVSKK